MDNKVNLYGASGHAKVIIDILNESKIAIESIIDDNPKAKAILGIEIKRTEKFDLNSLKNTIISIGNNKTRKKLTSQLKTSFSNAIHPKSIVSKTVSLGEGSVVMAGSVINADAKIGNHCIINTGAIIEHDCIIDNFVHISPRASLAGNVHVGEGSQIGINATIIQNIIIGKWAIIGAGAVVIKDIPDFAVVVGNPGRIIKFNKNE